MPSNNSKYTEEFREQIATRILETGQSATSLAEEMGIDTNTVCRWVRVYRRKHNMPTYAEEKGIRTRPPKDTIELKDRIKELERQIKGYRNITRELKAQGVEISEYRVRRLMKENGFYPELAVKFKPIRSGKSDGRYCENKVKQEFKTEKKNSLWA